MGQDERWGPKEAGGVHRPDLIPASSAPSLLLPAGDLSAQGLPGVAAAHHRPA